MRDVAPALQERYCKCWFCLFFNPFTVLLIVQANEETPLGRGVLC